MIPTLYLQSTPSPNPNLKNNLCDRFGYSVTPFRGSYAQETYTRGVAGKAGGGNRAGHPRDHVGEDRFGEVSAYQTTRMRDSVLPRGTDIALKAPLLNRQVKPR